MSETTIPSGSAEQGDEGTRGAQAAGAMLRKAREDAGLHVAALAVALKVPVKKLEALEAGRIDLLPDATFARGLAASICRGLKLDPKPVLDLMPGIGGSRLGAQAPAINERFEPTSMSSAAPWRLPKPALLAVGVLLLGALAMYFYPRQPDGTETAQAGPEASGTVEMSVPSAASAPVLQPESSAALPPAPAILPPPAEPAASAVAPASDATMVFTAKAESWVQVTDAKGVQVVRRTLQAGERVTASGALPLAVVVGRIDAVDVQVRGQPMNLAGIAKTNVARFEVK
ncbi:helix-turn-helix domain-containing protein [Pseudorhodoferax sp. Leaf267]|uniref:helix-turn-helix domain-containing protein n=1 Tax=Pseudorhodoferax sp. Leaf267 TaxID=1736316 RepID=UPI0006F98923|nr:helix-turn-helix domain-containing protein [Pseudorhodoferax sp. Leaf267]KQP22373.1 hypothetical protein ASF43_00095 [Pseudorhodoferax sp. Leaf267]